MIALKFTRKTQEDHKENAARNSKGTLYKAELSHALCIHLLHWHKMPRSDLQLADLHKHTHKFQMIMLTETEKAVILFH